VRIPGRYPTKIMSTTRRTFFLQAGLALPALAAPERRPNILLLFPDQLRYDWAGADRQIPVRTPNLNSLARRGVRFTRAVVPSPLCAPSRACLASGREYERCGVVNNGQDYPAGQTTYYGILRDHGYHVIGCGKIDLHKKTQYWGVDGKERLEEWGFSDGIDNAGKRDAPRSGGATPKDPYMAFLHKSGLAAAHVADFRKRKDTQIPFQHPCPTMRIAITGSRITASSCCAGRLKTNRGTWP